MNSWGTYGWTRLMARGFSRLRKIGLAVGSDKRDSGSERQPADRIELVQYITSFAVCCTLYVHVVGSKQLLKSYPAARRCATTTYSTSAENRARYQFG